MVLRLFAMFLINMKSINFATHYMILGKKSRERGDTLYDNAQPLASFIKGDLCSFRELDDFDFVVCNKRIVEGVKSLIGDDLVYFGESNTQTGTAARGNHKDNRIIDREDASGYDWKGDYSLVRVGLYLNDSDSTSGGLKVIPGSHKIPTSHFYRGGVNVSAKAGDLVVWFLTTTHSWER